MHALTCEVLERETYAYAAIPTYYEPAKYILAKVYIENVWHGEQVIFYHCIISDLLMTDNDLLQILPTCQVRCIERRNGKVDLRHIALRQFDMTKGAMLASIQAWQKDFIIDIPAPYVVSTAENFEQLKKDIIAFHRQQLLTVERHFNLN